MSDDTASESPEVVNVPEKNRYVIRAGGRELGFTEYTDRGAQRVFLHTEIDPAEEGHGYGSALMAGTLGRVRDAGLRAVPVCPFMVGYLQRHHEFDEVIDPVSIQLRASLG